MSYCPTAGLLIALVYKTRRFVPESYKSYSMFASLVSGLTIGLMLACIICIMVFFILSSIGQYKLRIKNLFGLIRPAILDLGLVDIFDIQSNTVDAKDDTHIQEDDTLVNALDNLIVFESALYCLITANLLCKWVSKIQSFRNCYCNECL